MSQMQFYNVVYFLPSASSASSPSPVALTLDRPWKLSAGLKPDINQATCPAPEFAKISDVNAGGSIQFWFSNNPSGTSGTGGADMVIQDVKIVDIEPIGLGKFISTAGGSVAPQQGYHEYRLSFSDFRESFVAPRGGRLAVGPINVGNAGKPTGTTSTTSTSAEVATPELNMVQLVTLCLQSMNVQTPEGAWASGNWGNIPSSLNDVDAPRNLKWFGNHAPTELEKLLTLAGHVFCPHCDGTFTIEQMTASGSPTLGTSSGQYTMIPAGNSQKIDQRGEYVVIGSWPTRVINTETLTGPNGTAGSTFEFVVYSGGTSGTGKWVTLAEYFGSDATAASAFEAWVLGGQQGLSLYAQQNPALAPLLATLAMGQAFSCVRVTAQTAQHFISPILAACFEADGTTRPIQITANAAAKNTAGSWYMPSGSGQTALQFQATHRLEGNVLALSAPAFKVDSNGNFQPLGSSDMTLRISIEQFQTNPAAQGDTTGAQPQLSPLYYMSGWSAGADGTPMQLSDDDTQNAVNGRTKGVLTIARPELRSLIVDGEEINRATLDAVAKTIAGKYLKPGAGSGTVVQSCIGFAFCQPSGLVTSIEWDQKAVRTTARCNDWYTAASAVGIHDIRKLEGGTGSGQSDSEAHPHESTTQSDRSSLGASGDSPRTLALAPSPAAPGGYATPWGWSTGPLAGVGGAYNGMVLTNPAQAITVGAGFIQISFSAGVGSGSPAAGTACVIIVPAENDSTIASLPSQVLIGLTPMPPMPALSAALGVAATVPIYLAQWDPTAIRSVTYDPIGHNFNDSVFSSPTVPQQKLIVHLVDCITGT
jgi:hypothetical protein